MKELVLLFILALGFIKGNTQVNFIWKEITPLQQTALSVKQIGNSYFLCNDNRTETTGPYMNSKISKIDLNGQLISSILFNLGDSSCYYIDNILPLNKAEFLAFGNHKSMSFS